jgi:hypothetical protein
VTHIRLLVYGDPVIGSKLLVELIAAHVDRHRLFGTTLKHTVGKAARRRPDINYSAPVRIDGEPVESGIEFLASAAYEPRTIAENKYRFARIDHARWLQRRGTANGDLPRLDQLSSSSTARCQVAAHEFSIEAAPSSHCELRAEARAYER